LKKEKEMSQEENNSRNFSELRNIGQRFLQNNALIIGGVIFILVFYLLFFK